MAITNKKKAVPPMVLVIFGATGDLARNKLFSAIFDLANKGKLPDKYSIIGFSRRDWTDQDFQNFVSEILIQTNKINSRAVADFTKSLRYVKGDFGTINDYKTVYEIISEIDKGRKVCSDRLLYLAAPPAQYESILNGISESGLSIPCGGDKGWARILIEKPFGTNIKTAEQLEKFLAKRFKEEQIFRIDHYLAKETIQNILTFRFSNTIFEPVWNRKFIESVHISLSEKDRGDTENRGAFYDGLGAVRDVGQNHLLQMLALVAMENPGTFDAKNVRKGRSAIFKKLSLNKNSVHIRGQYDGYLAEKNVALDSDTETYFFTEVNIKNSRWRGVPFYLEAGKKMSNDEVKIKIIFKPEAFCLSAPLCNIYHNQIIFHIQPREEIEIRFWAKKSGFKIDLESKNFLFSYKDNPKIGNAPAAYEKVLFDAIMGDQTLFASTEEIANSWRFISKVLEIIKKKSLLKYKIGSNFEMGKLIT